MTIAYRQRRKERKRLTRRRLQAQLEGQEQMLLRAAVLLGRGFWGRLKWACFKR